MSLEARVRLQRGGFRLDVDLSLPERGVSAIVGPSGSGKTTLLRVLCGLEPRAEGEVRLGEEIWQGEGVFVPVHRRGASLVFQESALFSHLDVEGNLRYARRRAPAGGLSLGEVVSMLALEPLLGRRTDGLSGGERQRVAIARALLSAPRLLLLDEPMAALDEAARAELLPLLEGLFRRLALPVVYVSHASREVRRLADHLILLEDGRVRAAGPLAELVTRLDLPLAHAPEAATILEAEVMGSVDDGLVALRFSGGRLLLVETPRLAGHPPGTRVRLEVRARDVSLTLERQSGTSILNIFEAQVVALAEDGPARVTARLDLAGTPLIARITRRSARRLGLREGQRVFAQVKSVALL